MSDFDQKFPLGKPLNRPAPVVHKPGREEVKKGIFSIGGKLQTDLKINGPRKDPDKLDPLKPWEGIGCFWMDLED